MKGFLKIEATEEGTYTSLSTEVNLKRIRPVDRIHMVKVFLAGMEMTTAEAALAIQLINDGFFEKDEDAGNGPETPTEPPTNNHDTI